MRRFSRTSCDSAFSLPELLVCLLLLSFVLAALGGLLRNAVRFYIDQSATLEVQKNCVLALQRLGKELRETNVDSLDATSPNLVIFASPRDIDGGVSYNDGRLMWHKFIKFSIEDVDGVSVLVREDDRLDSPTSEPPPPGFSDFSTPSRRQSQAQHIESLEVNVTGRKAEVTIKGKYRDLFEMTLKTDLKLQN